MRIADVRHRLTIAFVAAIALLPSAVRAQERTLDEVKREITRRAATRTPPFDHVRADEVEEVLRSLTSLDKDEWGSKWCQVGLAHEARGDALAKNNAPPAEIRDAYDLAFGYCLIGRYPVPSSAAKRAAYGHALRTFRKAARYFETPAPRRRNSVRRQDADRLSADAERCDAPAGRHVLGRCGRLERRPPAQFRNHAPGGTRDLPHRRSRDRRESGRVHRPERRARVFGGDDPPGHAHGRRRLARRRVGPQLRRLLDGQTCAYRAGAPEGRGLSRRQRALRLPGGVAAPRADQERRQLPARTGQPLRLAELRSGREDARGRVPRGAASSRSRTAVCSTNPPRQS